MAWRPRQRIEAGLLDLAYAHDLPLVATNDVFFADRSMFEAHDALLCIAGGTLCRRGRAPARSRRSITSRSAAEMRALFADLPEAVDNTLVIARRCAFMPEPRKPILPAFPGARTAHRGRGAAPPAPPTVSSIGWTPGLRRRDGSGRPSAGRQALSRAARIRARRHRADGLPRLLPDRRRLHPVGEGAGHSRSGRAAARAPARSSPGR